MWPGGKIDLIKPNKGTVRRDIYKPFHQPLTFVLSSPLKAHTYISIHPSTQSTTMNHVNEPLRLLFDGDIDLSVYLGRPYEIGSSSLFKPLNCASTHDLFLAPVPKDAPVSGPCTQSPPYLYLGSSEEPLLHPSTDDLFLLLDSSLTYVEGPNMGASSHSESEWLSFGLSDPSFPSNSASSSYPNPSSSYQSDSSLNDPAFFATLIEFLSSTNVASSTSSYPPSQLSTSYPSSSDSSYSSGSSYPSNASQQLTNVVHYSPLDSSHTTGSSTDTSAHTGSVHRREHQSFAAHPHPYTRPLGSSSTYNSGPIPDARASHSQHQLSSTNQTTSGPYHSSIPSYRTQMPSSTPSSNHTTPQTGPCNDGSTQTNTISSLDHSTHSTTSSPAPSREFIVVEYPPSEITSLSRVTDTAVPDAPKQTAPKQKAPKASKGKGKARLVDQGEDTDNLDSEPQAEVQVNLKKRKRKEGLDNGRSVRTKVEQPTREMNKGNSLVNPVKCRMTKSLPLLSFSFRYYSYWIASHPHPSLAASESHRRDSSGDESQWLG